MAVIRERAAGPHRSCSCADTASRVGQLEQKIDGIMSLLSASQQIQQEQQFTQVQEEAPAQPAWGPPRPGSFSSHSPDDGQVGSHQRECGNVDPAHEPPAVSVQSLLSPGSPTQGLERFEIVPGLSVTLHEAEQALDVYREVYSPKFPFVPIHPQISAAELYEKQPFLFRMVIQTVVPQTWQIQDAAKLWFREHIARHVVIRAERSLELLQGILLFLAWYSARNYASFLTLETCC